MNATRTDLEKVALACRIGFMSLTDVRGSAFNGFPTMCCGIASEIMGEIIGETLKLEFELVIGKHHSTLEDEPSHAWIEVGEFILDVTYDQFHGTGLSGWVFDRGNGWHSQFTSQTRPGVCETWGDYPWDVYEAAQEEAKKVGLTFNTD